MFLTSLIHQTDLIFHKFDGIITDHGDYLSIETPSNPNFFWGNYLIFSNPPKPGDVTQWRRLFVDRFKHNSEIKHQAFAWDNKEEGSLQQFIDQGFKAEQHVALTAQAITKPKKWNTELTVHPLKGEKDWEIALESQVLANKKEYAEDRYRKFRKSKNERFQKMIAEGLGQWFGAFVDGKLVGDMGLFKSDSLGRFQNVSTHPDYQRQGVCSTLLYHVGNYGLSEMDLKTLVMAADQDYFAKDIYISVGFKITESITALELRPKGC